MCVRVREKGVCLPLVLPAFTPRHLRGVAKTALIFGGSGPTSTGSPTNEDTHVINDALRTILPFGDWSEKHTDAIEITGGADPILPTPFKLGETSAATLAAVGLA